jgi:DNA-directed RNA polymerase beta subunit
LCAEKCAHVDATIFKKVDLESIATELENLGLNKYGYRRMYNGITGEYIDCMVFVGPTYYQRLQKFTVDTMYSISAGPSDAITYQPLDKLLLVQVKNKIFASRILIGNTFKLQESLSNL